MILLRNLLVCIAMSRFFRRQAAELLLTTDVLLEASRTSTADVLQRMVQNRPDISSEPAAAIEQAGTIEENQVKATA